MKNEFTQHLKQLETLFQNLPQDIAVLAADEFDRNFERQSFFGNKWKPSEYVKRTRSGGKLLVKTGALRLSIAYKIIGARIEFSSRLPYAQIHNQGGVINHPGGTAYFKKKGETIWISNRKAAGKNYPRTKPHKINIPQRQFVGEHPKLDKMIEEEIEQQIMDAFK